MPLNFNSEIECSLEIDFVLRSNQCRSHHTLLLNLGLDPAHDVHSAVFQRSAQDGRW